MPGRRRQVRHFWIKDQIQKVIRRNRRILTLNDIEPTLRLTTLSKIAEEPTAISQVPLRNRSHKSSGILSTGASL